MEEKLRVEEAPRESGKQLVPAKGRRKVAVPEITAKRDEIIAELEQRAAHNPRYAAWPEQVPGVAIGFLSGHEGPFCYELENHRLVVGRSGSGKATAVIVPMLLHDDGHAAVVVDPKDGLIVRATAGYRQALGPTYVIDPYNVTGFFGTGARSDAFNPLDALDPQSGTLIEDARNLASALCYLPDGSGDDHTYWDRKARSYVAGIIAHLVTAEDERADLLRLREITTMDVETFGDEILQPMLDSPQCGGAIERYGREIIQNAKGNPKAFTDILSTIQSYTDWIENEQVRTVTARSSFSFDEVRREGGTVYIVLEDDRLEECGSWLRVMLQAARLGLKRSGSRRPVHFVLDEAAALGKFDLITTALRAWRAAKIRLHLFYQSVGQIEQAFKDGASVVEGQEIVQFIGSNAGDGKTAEWLSKIFGERDVIVPTTGSGTSTTDGTTETNAKGKSDTQTETQSRNVSKTSTRTEGKSWSTATAHTQSRGSSYVGTATRGTSVTRGPQTLFDYAEWARGNSTGEQEGSSEARGTNESAGETTTKTSGDSSSTAKGATEGSGNSTARAIGTNETDTKGKSQSKGYSENRSFTLQLRKRLPPEDVRMLDDDLMIVVAGNHEAAFVHKEHFFRNPRMVRRSLMRFVPEGTEN